MKKILLKKTLISTALLAVSGYTVMAQAHCIGDLGNFGPSQITQASTSTTQYDTYVTVCPLTATGAQARVAKKSTGTAGAAVTVKVAKGGYTPATSSDTTVSAGTLAVPVPNICNGALNESIGTGAGAFTPVSAGGVGFGGPGQYTVIVSKDSALTQYSMEFHCLGDDTPNSQSFLDGLPNGVNSTNEFDRIMDH